MVIDPEIEEEVKITYTTYYLFVFRYHRCLIGTLHSSMLILADIHWILHWKMKPLVQFYQPF